MTKAAVARKKQPSPCTPFSVEVAVLTPDDTREIHFGISRGCNPDNTTFWTVDFILNEIADGTSKTRVEVHVRVGQDQHAKAEALAKAKKLTPSKVNLLQGRIADVAAELPPGTTDDVELSNLLLRTL